MSGCLCCSATHVVVNVLFCEGSWIGLYIPCHDEKEQGKCQEAHIVVDVFVFSGPLCCVVLIDSIGDGCV